MSSNSSGSNFRVNTFSSGRQEKPDIAVGSLGNFVITWQSEDQDGDGIGIFARAYNASATPLAPEFQVNTTTLEDQAAPAVAIDSNSNFVVTWTSDQLGANGQDVYAQRFNSIGAPLGAEFRVNRSTSLDQTNPDVAMDSVGNFVVVYESEQQDDNTVGRDSDGTGAFGQRFDRSGAPIGLEFRINTRTENDQTAPVVAMNAQGAFVAVWVSDRQDGSGTGIYGQRYNSAGVPVGAEFQVNTETDGNQLNPTVALDNSGNFVVAWQSDSQDDDGYGIYARRYRPNGNPTQHEFRVNTTTRNDQIDPAVAIDANGNFTVVWASERQDGDGFGIFGQRFLRDGRPSGSEFGVNRRTANDQTQPTVGLTPTSDSVVAWQDQSNDDDQNILASSQALKQEIRGDRFDNTLKGTSQGDRILGLRGADTLRGLGGNDVLEGGLGDDRLEGGNQDDLLLGNANSDTLDGGNGNDILTGGAGSDTFVLRVKQGTTLITDFQDGVDLLGLSAGIEPAGIRLEQQANNTIVSWRGLTLATLLGINTNQISFPVDFVSASRSGREINGTSANDSLTGAGGGDEINGRGGNDTLSGRAGDDALNGGNDNDRLFGEIGNDTLDGGNGNDRLFGDKGDDYLIAGNGNDQLTGGEGADIFLLQRKTGTTVIKDFQDGIDFFSLDTGLNINQLQAQQQGSDTVISTNGQQLALVKNILVSQINFAPSDFL